mmetsp:Transcript_1092/g.2944  ORF Transcript_1092/g.2944 Transcript_1092/m.2944 type:complete len:212 (-) Transcript_1092:672-1307(-)
MLARQQVFAARVPGWVVQHPEVFLGDGMRLAAIGVHDPEVVAAARVAQIGDALAIRREAGLLLPGDGMGQGLGLTAGDRQGVEVTQQVEDQGLAVGADVDAHPGATRHIDAGRLGRAGRRVDAPGGWLRRRGVLGVSGQGGREQQRGQGLQSVHGSGCGSSESSSLTAVAVPANGHSGKSPSRRGPEPWAAPAQPTIHQTNKPPKISHCRP